MNELKGKLGFKRSFTGRKLNDLLPKITRAEFQPVNIRIVDNSGSIVNIDMKNGLSMVTLAELKKHYKYCYGTDLQDENIVIKVTA